MNNTMLTVEKRTVSTRGELRRLRREGKVPAVLYGKDVAESTPITVDGKELQSLLRSNPNAVLEIEVPGQGRNNVLMSEVQRDSMSREVVHIDFHKINMNESIKAPVRIDVSGKSAGEKEGGMLQVILHEIEVECLARDLPDSIHLDVESLQVGDHLTVGDLKLPDNVKTTLDPDTVLVAVLAPQKEIAEDEPEAAEESADEEETAKAAE